jgi:hypothetical protein
MLAGRQGAGFVNLATKFVLPTEISTLSSAINLGEKFPAALNDAIERHINFLVRAMELHVS